MSDTKIRFTNEEEIEDVVEHQLKKKYGRGIFIQEYTKTSDGTLFIDLGNAAPKDVSDCRDRDRVLKFIEYESIYQLKAEPVKSGYILDLADRNEVYSGFQNRKRELSRQLDRSMARAIYEKLVGFPELENQLGAIKSILRTVREEGPVSISTIHDIRGTRPDDREKTMAYMQILSDTDFVRIEYEEPESTNEAVQSTLQENLVPDTNTRQGVIRAGPYLDSYDLNSVANDEFSRFVLGQVVNEAYSTLKDERNITLLAHYPKYANSYYFTAIERQKPDIHLDAETARENIRTLYGDDENEILVRQKLDDLAEADVVQKEGDFYRSNKEVYKSLSTQAVA